jgi:hypothetical protein
MIMLFVNVDVFLLRLVSLGSHMFNTVADFWGRA